MRRRRQVFAVTAAAFLLGLAVVAYCLRPGGPLCASELAHAVALLVSLDRLKLEIAPPFASSRVDVFWHASAGEEGERLRQVVSAGVLAAPIPRVYGENDVEIRYGGKRVDMLRQFKTAWWHYHVYCISLRPNAAGVPMATLTATGPDAIQ